MPKIDFYILQDHQHLLFVCRLIEKIYKQRHRIYVYTDQQQEAHALDELLWTYREDSFLPHNLYGEGPDTAPPIQIGFNQIPENHRDILINLSQTVPTFFQQFSRILELVPQDENMQKCARERYRYYQTQGCSITTHKLQTADI